MRKKVVFLVCLSAFINISVPVLSKEIIESKITEDNTNKELTDLNKKVNKNPNNIENYLNRAAYYNSINKFELAIEDYNKAIRLNPKSSHAYYCRGYSYRMLNEFELSIKSFNMCLSIDSSLENQIAVYTDRGVTYMLQGDDQKAIRDLTNAILLDPENIRAYESRALLYVIRKHYDNAISDYSKIIEIDDENSQAYADRASAYESLGKYNEAIKDYTSAINLEIEDKELVHDYISRSYIYRQLKQYQLQINDLTEAIKLNPIQNDLLDAYKDRAKAYSNLKMFDESISDYKKANKISPDDNLIIYDLKDELNEYGNELIKQGKASEGKNKLDESSKIVIKEQEKFSKEEELIFFKAMKERNQDKKLAYMNDVIKNKSISDKLLSFLSFSYEQIALNQHENKEFIESKNNFEIAKSLLERKLTSDEHTKLGIKVINNSLKDVYPLVIRDYFMKHYYKEAIDESNKLIEIEPQRAYPYMIIGYSKFKLGKQKEGISLILKSINMNPKNSTAYYNLARAYAIENNIELSLKYLIEAIDLEPGFKSYSLKDEDLNNIKKDKRFIRLVN